MLSNVHILGTLTEFVLSNQDKYVAAISSADDYAGRIDIVGQWLCPVDTAARQRIVA